MEFGVSILRKGGKLVPHGRYLLPHEGVPQGLAATYTCSGITAYSALKKTRSHLSADDHLVIIGAGGVGGSAVHIAPAAVSGKVIVADIDAQKRAHARQMGAVATKSFSWGNLQFF